MRVRIRVRIRARFRARFSYLETTPNKLLVLLEKPRDCRDHS